jgi:GNAT superfamily N-acetyltransferase
MIELLRTSSSHHHFAQLVTQLDKELWERYPALYAEYAPLDKIADNNNTVTIAYKNGQPVGCGCFKVIDRQTIEIKRMYVTPAYRSQGIAGALLAELENWARELHFSRARLETGSLQPEALHLYKKSGYTIIDNYGPYVGMSDSVCMEKQL